MDLHKNLEINLNILIYVASMIQVGGSIESLKVLSV